MRALGAGPVRVVSIGEAMVELSAVDFTAGRARLGVAGDTLNAAIYLARALSDGAGTVDYVTVLGRDGLSEAMVARIAAEGVGTRHIRRHPARLPGIYAIELDARGERSFRYWRDASAARTLFESGSADLEALDGAEAIYLSGITLAILSQAARSALIGACAKARADGRIVAFDPNYRSALWPDPAQARLCFDAMWRATTLALPSAEDERALRPGERDDEILARIGASVDEVVLKRGASGPLLHAAGGRPIALPPDPAPHVVDTTGAGDSFNAAYLAARLRGRPPREAAAQGHRLACRVIAHRGAIVPKPA